MTQATSWYGLKIPDGLEYSSAVGARAIHRREDNPGCDFVGNRWAYLGGDDDLMTWIKQKGVDFVRNNAGVRGTGDEPLQLDDGLFHAKFKVNYDHVHCLFWKDVEK